jgi:hypothetical protein
MGWILPFLYQAAEKDPTSFKDITVGNNKFGKCGGFNCTTGWDPMTG